MSYYPSNTEKAIKEVEKILDQEQYTNVLTQMDNWTYHIRLSMLSNDDYKQYLKYKDSLLNENQPNLKKMQQIIDNKGIVIAETGLLHNLFIDSLTTKTISSVGKSFTTEGKLTLVDLEGTGLVNKLNILSLMTGNDAHFSNQVYFITIWFVGYNGTNTIQYSSDGISTIGMPNKEIDVFKPLKTYTNQTTTTEDEVGEKTTNTYTRTSVDRSTSKVYLEVTFTDVKCTTSTNKATWVMNFASQNSSALTPQEVCVLSDLPEIQLKKGDKYLEVIPRLLSKNINDKIKKQMGEDAFRLAYYDKTDLTSGTSDNATCFDITIRNEFKEILYSTIPSIQLKKRSYSGLDSLTNYSSNKSYVTTSVNQSITNDTTLKFDSKTNLLTVFENIISEANQDDKEINYTPRITVVNKPMNVYNGKRYYHTFITIWLEYTPGMDLCMSGSSYPAKLKAIEEAQVNFMKNMPEHNNMFIRKYEWMTGNNKNGLLSYDSNKNNLWYLNSGMADKESAAHNTLNSQARTMNYEKTNMTQILNTPVNKKKYPTLPSDIKNINDAWNFAKETNMIETLSLYPIAIKDSNIGANDPITNSPGTVKDNISRAATRIGYQNLLTSGNAQTIKLNIIGDPIWLDLGSAVLAEDIQTSLNMMILFKENTTFNLNNMDEYEPDPLLQSIVPYTITEITSDFCNGDFKQTLDGNTPVNFLFDKNSIDELANIKIIEAG